MTAPSAVEWYDRAACGGQNARTFDEATPAEAKEICCGCPVRVECLYDALTSKAPNGIWGGLTYPERRKLPALPAGRSDALEALSQALQAAAAAADTPAAPRQQSAKPKPAQASERKVKAPARRKPEAVPAAREDVAELLRQGRTQRQVMAELNVSHRVVIATRKAYKIPYPKGQGFRYSPEQRAENERRTIELLRAGATYRQIMDAVGISQPTIIAIRRKAGLPKPDNKPGLPARSRAEALAQNSEPYGDGHVRWTGSRAGRALQLNAENRTFNARRVVFELRHGRAPFGPLRSNCGITDCIAGAHLTDTLLRAAHPDKEPAMSTTDATVTPPSASSSPAPATAEPLPISELLKWGDEHPDKAVQNKAAQARTALDELRTRHTADQELTAISDEATQLEKRLAELRAREAELAPKKKRKSPTRVRDYDTRTVRAWAGANGVDCPRVGQIPKRVLDAWRAATSTGGGE